MLIKHHWTLYLVHPILSTPSEGYYKGARTDVIK